MTPTIAKSTTLYYREGSSDKVYQAAIEPADGGDQYVVTFAYGRHGSTLNTGLKTPQPVPLAEANKVFDKLVASKLAKGGTPGEDGTPYAGTGNGDVDTGVRPQLLSPIEEAELETLLADEWTLMQEKFDGRRMLVRKSADGVTGINRRGLAVALPQSIADEAAVLPGTFLINGEAVGDTLHAFDLLEYDAIDLRGRGCIDRLTALEDLLHAAGMEAILPVPTAVYPPGKRALLDELRRRNAEGVVFKQRYGQYRPGRPASGGHRFESKSTTGIRGRSADTPSSSRHPPTAPLGRPPIGRRSTPAPRPTPISYP